MGEALLLTLWPSFPNGSCLRRGLALALADEAMILPLTDEPEVAAVSILALRTDNHSRAPAKFQRNGGCLRFKGSDAALVQYKSFAFR